MMLPRRVKKNFVRSSVVAPSKPLQGFSIRVSSSSIGRPGVSHNINGTVQLVSGLTLPPHHSSSITDTYPVEDKDSSQYPGYANKATRLQSFRDRGGITPPTELVDEGFFMVAPDVVKCCSCHVVVLGWKKKGIGSTSDIHCLHNSNCDFVKNCMQSEMQRANEFEDYTASQPVHVVNEVSSRNSLYSEKPVIKNRMKEGSRSTLLRPTMMVDRIPPHSIEYITPGVWYPPNQPSASQSVSRHGYVPKGSSTKSSYDVMATPSREQIILVSCGVSLLVQVLKNNNL